MATADKLAYLKATKEQIKQAITNKGVELAEDASFRSYAEAIDGISVGSSGEELPEEAFIITGDCANMFSNGQWAWYLDMFEDKIVTQNITNADSMFKSSSKESISFDINLNPSAPQRLYNMFSSCVNLKYIGKINNVNLETMTSMFADCYNLREVPEINFASCTYNNVRMDNMFKNCYSLRQIPSEFFETIDQYEVNDGYTFGNSGLYGCLSLNEVINFPTFTTEGVKSTAFLSLFSYMGAPMLKRFTFITNKNGTCKIKAWRQQTLDLSRSIGYLYGATSYYKSYILDYNSGITADKEVKDDATYQALKDDPDWFTGDVAYSRYNHDSAVETINSLPDTSAYLATAGGTNTIKFKGDAGSKTDGGAINTLTEEEIAVATARGWTVSFA